MSKIEHIRWGIIGCGNVTELKSGPAFNKVPNSSLVAVMRRDAEKAADYAQRHGVSKWYADAAQLINDPEINAIYVATPPDSHEAYAIAAMAAGKPVYVEKPMAVDVASCIRMQEMSERTGVKLTIAHYRRALPKFLFIKQLLEEKKIGDVRTIRLSLLQPDKSAMITKTATNWRVDPAVAGAGLFYDLAPHQLDIIQYFFGMPLQVMGISANQAGLYTAEDVVIAAMRFPGDIVFTGQWCYTVAEHLKDDKIEINGSQGGIAFSVFDHELIIKTDGEEKRMDFTPPQHIQQPMIERIVQYFLGKGSNPCSAADAIGSMSAMEACVYGAR